MSQRISTTLNGSLAGTTLADICQIMGDRTGALELQQDSQIARIYFNQGTLVHAELGDLFGKDAFLDAALWRDGSFQFVNGTLPSYVSIQERAMALIMEAAVYHDIWEQLHAAAIHEDTYLQALPLEESATQQIFQTAVHVDIYNHLLEPHTIREVVVDLIPEGIAKSDIIDGFWHLLQNHAIQPARQPPRNAARSTTQRLESTPVPEPLPAQAATTPSPPVHASASTPHRSLPVAPIGSTSASPSTPKQNANPPTLVMVGGVLLLLAVGIGGGAFLINNQSSNPPSPTTTAAAAPVSTAAQAAMAPSLPATTQPSAPIAAPTPEPTTLPVATTFPTPAPSPTVAVTAASAAALDALDTAALLAHEGQEVSVRGHILRTNTDPRSGITFLDIRTTPRQGFVFIIYPDDLGAWSDLGPPTELYRDTKFKATGRITVFNNLPQIVLRSPNQIQILR